LCDIAISPMDVCFRGKSGHAADITGMTASDPQRSLQKTVPWTHCFA
jgi:hypothetical protein